jgi:large subunit ribosomal protein L15
LPLIKRLPRKRGFTNIFKTGYNVINVGKLNVFPSGSEITPKEFLQAGLIKSLDQPTKILGDGDIQHSLLVKADKFSSVAEKKIVAAGGKVEKA